MKKRGASLIYVLIILSIITICTMNFIYFISERDKILRIREVTGND